MNKRWLEHESKQWVEKEIITTDQRKQLLMQYKEKESPPILPILASILIGIGILTLVASNWSEFENWLRLTILIGTMVLFYTVGFILYEKQKYVVGSGLLGLGYITLGAGIFLAGQMYQLQAYNANVFAVWGLVGLVLMLLYKEKFFYFLTFVVITVGQVYSLGNFFAINIYLFLLVLLGLGHFTYHRPSYVTNVLFSFSTIWMSFALILKKEWSIVWIYGIILIFSIGALLIRQKNNQKGFRHVSLLAGILLTILMVFDAFNGLKEPTSAFSIIIWFIVLCVYALLLYKKKEQSYEDLLLFIPYLIIPNHGDVVALIALFVYSILLLLRGYKEEVKEKVNIGILLFLLSVMIGYSLVAWTFLSKATFFFIGGFLLFILSFLLERKKRQTFRKKEKGAQS